MTNIEDDDQRNEESAMVESEMIDATQTLIEEFQYNQSDIEDILQSTVFNHESSTSK